MSVVFFLLKYFFVYFLLMFNFFLFLDGEFDVLNKRMENYIMIVFDMFNYYILNIIVVD